MIIDKWWLASLNFDIFIFVMRQTKERVVVTDINYYHIVLIIMNILFSTGPQVIVSMIVTFKIRYGL